MSRRTGTLKKDLAKAMLLMVSLIIGLSCVDSTDAFYIAVFVQSLNNASDSFEYIGHSSRLITGAYAIVLLGATLSFIFAIMHFSTETNAFADHNLVLVIVCVFLTIPLVILGIKIFVTIKRHEY